VHVRERPPCGGQRALCAHGIAVLFGAGADVLPAAHTAALQLRSATASAGIRLAGFGVCGFHAASGLSALGGLGTSATASGIAAAESGVDPVKRNPA